MSFWAIKHKRRIRISRERTQRKIDFSALFASFRGYLCVLRDEIPIAILRLALFLVVLKLSGTEAAAATAKQRSLDEWRSLTSPGTNAPRAFVRGDHTRIYFQVGTNFFEFTGNWSWHRVPTSGYRVDSALLRWKQRISKIPDGGRSWREATVIAGNDWRQLATNLFRELVPRTPGHGVYYQAFLADRLLYRDNEGLPRVVPLRDQPSGVIVDRRYTVEETLDVLARKVEEQFSQTHPGESLFVLMAPNANRFTQPLLVDRKQHVCVLLSPAALYDSTEYGINFAVTVEGISAMLFESHGLALIKNPVSSVARLVDLAAQTVARFIRPRFVGTPQELPAPLDRPGMNLAKWEAWLDRYTGTRLEEGSMDMLIDGDRFFTRLHQAIEEATNHIEMNLFIFDRDDVAVDVANQLKRRSANVKTKLLLDRMGTLAAGISPPATPLPESFVPPKSISPYLKKDSKIHVRSFLNPWFSADHCKVIIVDGARAWLGGMNIGREYRYEWHDLMVEVKGPVVASYENEFRKDWAHAGLLGDLAYAARVLSGPRLVGQLATRMHWPEDFAGKVRRLPTRTGWKPFGAAVFNSLGRAQSYIYAENPYLFDKKVLIKLVQARQRGVDVRIILPRVNDMKAGGRSNLVAANYLLEHGVRVYFYPGMTHVKALLVDGWACVGSGNLDHLSLRLSQEQNIATSDPGFAARLKRELFEDDFAHSYELTRTISVDWGDFLADLVLEGF
jgi:phosphatidylserine/phosphatidylglycerophosphate/cardiolipin synthase-like enzyme